MNRNEVMAWVARYLEAWRTSDVDAVSALFTVAAAYRRSPYEPSSVGHDAIRAFWADDDGTTFTARAEPVAVEADRAVVLVQVDYLTPRRQQYRDLWLLRFAPDGRVADFEEWPYWPGAPYSAAGP